MTDRKYCWIRTFNTGFFKFRKVRNGRQEHGTLYHITNIPELKTDETKMYVRRNTEYVVIPCRRGKRDFKEIRLEMDRFYTSYIRDKLQLHTDIPRLSRSKSATRVRR